jgi:undecaprenyl-diphosphatase
VPLAVPLALTAAFVVLAVGVALAGDVQGESHFTQAASGRWERQAALVAAATGYLPVAVATAALALALLLRGRRRSAVLVAVSVGGVLLTNPLLKRLVDRPRPDGLTADVSPFSFPSGHVAATAALATAVVLAAGGARRWWATAIVVVVVAAGAQLVLGRHHPTDLLGGWLWATAWTTAVWHAAPAGRAPCPGVRRRAGPGA